MDVAIVGPGRLGRSLAVLLEGAGARVTLCGRGTPPPPSDVVLLTVPDRSLAAVAAELRVDGVLLHCSGAHTVDVLRPHRPAGSLHPLMTFPGPEVGIPSLEGVPGAVDGDPEARVAALELCGLLGIRPLEVPGDRRLYHAAAVLAGNLATVLLAEGERVLAQAGVEDGAAVLAPLMLRSIAGATGDPSAALTGPIVRGDTAVVDAHRHALKDAGLKDVLSVYDLLSRRARDLVR